MWSNELFLYFTYLLTSDKFQTPKSSLQEIKMQTETQQKKFRGLPFLPSWYHHHGLKMQVREFCEEKGYLAIANNTAAVIIDRNRETTVSNADRNYHVSWQIIHWMSNDKTTGELTFSEDDLSVAFRLTEKNSDLEQECEGKYFRFKNYLNIPCPGTGDDGDPNISIYLSREIKNAVRKFIT